MDLLEATILANYWSFIGATLLNEYLYWYGQFSKSYLCFCGLDPGNLKFETVRTDKQHICF